MYSSFQLAYRYWRYYLGAYNSKGHGVHSPFVFDFIERVLNEERYFHAYRVVENLRSVLVHSHKEISTLLRPVRHDQLLFRFTDRYAPKQILELGTASGITIAYMCMANPDVSVTTLEPDMRLAEIARQQLKKLDIQNVRVLEGDMTVSLDRWLQQNRSIDMLLMDGNYCGSGLLTYFQQLIDHVHNDTAIAITRIHHNKKMEEAWIEICRHPSVTLSMDLFDTGFVFFKKEFKIKQHFPIRF